MAGIQRNVSAYYTLLVYDIEFTAYCSSATSSSHYTLTNFRGGGGGEGGKAPCPPPQYANKPFYSNIM